MQQSTPYLSFRGITMTFPGVKALSDISFDCYAGQVHALMGENGAEKSTLLKVL
ncbi:ATP-binding cassette domain-containing protein, partial [Helicobacter pylori]|uniref:ATP-binding cassette domain-containing protein n=1 Tax=Helicobacter pylori TaxID=210 RepID=UPI001ABA48F8